MYTILVSLLSSLVLEKEGESEYMVHVANYACISIMPTIVVEILVLPTPSEISR